MSAEDFADLKGFNSRSGGAKAVRPCHDCPLGYAAEMRALGRCNGTPAGVAGDLLTQWKAIV
jgi:hypothetical protein